MSTPRPAPTEPGEPASFMQRVLATLLDGVLLTFTPIVLWQFAAGGAERFMQLIIYAMPVLMIIYSGVLQSRLGGGRTLGKRLVGLRVVALDGELLSLDRSLARSAIVSVAPLLSVVGTSFGHALPISLLPKLASFQSVIGRGLFVACFLAVPFRSLHRGLHDVLTGTLVVSGNNPDPVYVAAQRNPERDRRFAVIAIGAIVVGGAIFAF